MDYVVHAAGYGQPDKFQANPFTTILLNSFSLIYLLNKIGQQGRLLYCSSSEIYSGLSSRIFDERQIGTSSPQHPRAGYIESKRIGEAICSQFNSQKSERKRVISARIALAYGPGFKLSDSRVLNNFIDKALIEKRINLLDTGKSKRTYCYIGDTVEMCLKLLIYGNEDVYNVGGISSISIRKLAEMIGQITSVPVQYPETDENKKIGSPNHVKLDMTKTIKFCGKAEFTNLEQGLEKTIKWRKSYLAANYKI
jgi:nucleoside-diphosphate-sugar epimerase